MIEMTEATKAATHTIELTESIYQKVVHLANELELDPAELIAQLIREERRRRDRVRSWRLLVEDVQKSGHPLIGKTEDEVVEQMRRIREEIWDAEYAHLYG